MKLLKDIFLKGIIPLAIGIPLMIVLPQSVLSWAMVFMATIFAWLIGVTIIALLLTIAHYYRKSIHGRVEIC